VQELALAWVQELVLDVDAEASTFDLLPSLSVLAHS